MTKIINIITPTYYPAVNGVSFVVQRNVEALIKLGYSVNVLTSEGAIKFLSENVYVFKIKGNGTFINPIKGDIASYIDMLNRLSSDAELNIFHAWHSWSTNLILKVNFLPDTKNIIYSHGTSFDSLEPVIQRFSRRILYFDEKNKIKKGIKKIDGLITIVENKAHPRCYDNKIFSGKAYYLPNPLPLRKIETDSLTFELDSLFSNDKRTAFCISNFEPIKNQLYLIKLSKEYSFNLVLLGSKPTRYSQRLINFIDEEKMNDQVKMFFELNDSTIQMLFKSADFFLFASRNDFSPLVLIEANKYGLPFISFLTADAVNPGGIFCRNSKEYAVAINKYIQSAKAELTSIGVAGQKYYEDFHSFSKYTNNLNDCIRNVLNIK